jgi:hypothetical protein
MKELTPRTTRPWKVVAEEVAHESNPEKLTQLIVELKQALDEQGFGEQGIGERGIDGQRFGEQGIAKPTNKAGAPANPSSSTKS